MSLESLTISADGFTVSVDLVGYDPDPLGGERQAWAWRVEYPGGVSISGDSDMVLTGVWARWTAREAIDALGDFLLAHAETADFPESENRDMFPHSPEVSREAGELAKIAYGLES